MKVNVARVSNRLYDGVRRSQQTGKKGCRLRKSLCDALAIGVLVGFISVIGGAQAQKPTMPTQLNAPFFAALDAYQNTHSASALNQLQSALAARRQILSDAISSNPALVLDAALPNDVKSRVPASLQGLLEKHVTVRGLAEVAIEEGRDYSRIDYGIKISGRRLALSFAGNVPSDWLTDVPVQVSGIQIGNKVALNAKDASVLE